jgi:hypothetical protein
VAGFRLLHGIHCQRANCVDAELIEFGSAAAQARGSFGFSEG